ncbi:aminotransferase class V-fold PLP-dependent enzyme [Gryllotalpicola ginsengisoli]|uniref:aminotransferase class V-fold PLP-dependent enzyme n=1 Tax=Gryllotalpicola ginsengisoli TaxID=444608 RepID=UPI0003B45732|nr:aminotransferase class V-fold PLP-dependent enzyme [Gryllotalpicola ginsengisoli]
MIPLADARAEFAADTGYLSACTMGLGAARVRRALAEDLELWGAGCATAVRYEQAIARSRAAFGRLVGVPAGQVAIGSQVSVQVAQVAAGVPDGAEVLCVDGDFSSVVTPFVQQAARGVRVRHVPLERLADAVAGDTWLVAFSLVQSASGAIADVEAVLEASARHGARTLVDLTQSAGWLPFDASSADVTVTHAYKWLCAPRGASLMTVGDRMLPLIPSVQAGWYAGEAVWDSCYGPSIELAADARRFDVSPAWQAWVGAAEALELFADVDAAAVHAHDAGLGDALCDALGLPQRGQAIITWADPDGRALAALTAAGLVASGRAGNVRVAFHLWNDERDVARVVDAVR